MSVQRAYSRFERKLLGWGLVSIALCGFVALMAATKAPAWYFAHMMLAGAAVAPLALLASRWTIAYTIAYVAVLALYFVVLGARDQGVFLFVSTLGIPIAAAALIHASVRFRNCKESGRIYAFVLAYADGQLERARGQLTALTATGQRRRRERLEARIRELAEDAQEIRRTLTRLGIPPLELKEVGARIHNPFRALAGLESAIDSCKARLRRLLSGKRQL